MTKPTMASITTPLSTQLLSRPIDLQQQSPLYSLLPQEIRDQIFAYACTPYTPAAPPPPPRVSSLYPSTSAPKPPRPNPWNPSRTPYDTNTTYSRPGQRAKVHHPTALLRACRRAYLETAHLPVALAAHNFHAPAASGPADVLDPAAYFRRMTPQQRPLVRQVRVFAGVPWILDGGLDALCAHDAMRRVELLNVVVRWCDWPGWQKNEPLSLDAARPSTAAAADDDDDDVPAPPLQDPAQQELEFATPAPPADAFAAPPPQPQPRHADVRAALAAAIAQLESLKAVRLSLEAPYVKADELDAQVAAILGWMLTLRGSGRGVTGAVQRRFEWEAPMCAWSDFCAHCGGGIGDDKACEERKRRRVRRLGPRVQGVVVRWR